MTTKVVATSDPPDGVRHVFEGMTASVVSEWRDGELWQVVTLESPAFEGVAVRLEFVSHVAPPRTDEGGD